MGSEVTFIPLYRSPMHRRFSRLFSVFLISVSLIACTKTKETHTIREIVTVDSGSVGETSGDDRAPAQDDSGGETRQPDGPAGPAGREEPAAADPARRSEPQREDEARGTAGNADGGARTAPGPPLPAAAGPAGARLQVVPARVRMAPETTYALRAWLVNAQQQVLVSTPEQPRIIHWTVEDERVAQVDPAGVVVAGAATGTTNVQATVVQGGEALTRSVTIEVTDTVGYRRISPEYPRLALAPGQSVLNRYQAVAFDGAVVSPRCRESTATEEVDTVLFEATDRAGVWRITAREPGLAGLVWQCDGQPAVVVQVEVRPLPAVTASQAEDGAGFGYRPSLTAERTPQMSSYDPAGQRLVWSSLTAPAASEPVDTITFSHPVSVVFDDPLRAGGTLLCAVPRTTLRCWRRSADEPWRQTPVAAVQSAAGSYPWPLAGRIDPQGRVHLLFYNAISQQLELAESADPGREDWQSTVVWNGEVGDYDVALTPQGAPRVVFQAGGTVYFAAPGGPGFWRFERIASTDRPDQTVIFAGIRENVPQVVVASERSLAVAAKVAQQWVWRPVFPAVDPDPLSVVARLGARGRLHVSFYDRQAGQRQYWYSEKPDRSGEVSWQPLPLFGAAALAGPAALAIDRQQRSWLAGFSDTLGQPLVFVGPAWLDYEAFAAEPAEPVANAGVTSALTPAPVLLGVVAGNGENQLTWTAVPGADSYNVYWNNAGQVQEKDQQITSVTVPRFTHTGLDNGVGYVYAVTAVGRFGESALSNEIAAVPGLTAPGGLFVTATDTGNVLSWEAVAGADSYVIYWNTTGSPGVDDPVLLTPDGRNRLVHENIDPGQTYYYAVAATGGGDRSRLSAPVSAPATPRDVEAVARFEDGALEVSWQKVEGATAYQVYYAAFPDLDRDSADVIRVEQPPFIHRDLGDGATYYYAVAALTEGGESRLSDVVSATSRLNSGELTWQRATPMRTPRMSFGLAVINGYLYALGGFDGERMLSSMEVRDPQTGLWRPVAGFATPSRGFAMVAWKGRLYVFGGWDGLSAMHRFEIYDPQEDRWQRQFRLARKRTGAVAAVAGDRIYLIGGWNGEYLRDNDQYDPATGRWQERDPLPTARSDMAAAVLNGEIYVSGGERGGVLPVVEVYNPRSNTWRNARSMITARRGHAMVAYQGKLYVFGGWNGEQIVRTVEVFDPATGHWTLSDDLPTPRQGLAGVTSGGEIFVAGGWDGRGRSQIVEVFGPAPQ